MTVFVASKIANVVIRRIHAENENKKKTIAVNFVPRTLRLATTTMPGCGAFVFVEAAAAAATVYSCD